MRANLHSRRRLVFVPMLIALVLALVPAGAAAANSPDNVVLTTNLTCYDTSRVGADLTIHNAGDETLEIFEVVLAITPLRPRDQITWAGFILLIPEAAHMPPGDSAELGVIFPTEEPDSFKAREIAVSVEVYYFGYPDPVTQYSVFPGCGPSVLRVGK